jgi:hypothetical protein
MRFGISFFSRFLAREDKFEIFISERPPRLFGFCVAAPTSIPLAASQTPGASVAALPSTDALLPAPAVAELLNASGSEDSH